MPGLNHIEITYAIKGWGSNKVINEPANEAINLKNV
jgi:hypothetical protein